MPRDRVIPTSKAGAVRRPRSRRLDNDLLDAAKEEKAWKEMVKVVDLVKAFRFWNEHLQLRSGPAQDKLLTASETERMLLLIRAMSWVDSRHSTSVGSGERDPMQSGNPADMWWQQVSGVLPGGDRVVGGPGGPNYHPDKMPAAFDGLLAGPPGLEAGSTKRLGAVRKGHDDAGFNKVMSYVWAIPAVLHKTNAVSPASRKTCKCHRRVLSIEILNSSNRVVFGRSLERSMVFHYEPSGKISAVRFAPGDEAIIHSFCFETGTKKALGPK